MSTTFKKSIAMFSLAFAMTLSAGVIRVHAANGPNQDADSMAGITTQDPIGNYSLIFFRGSTNNLDGITYDKTTNTLTLSNYNRPENTIITYEMGDDFKIKVIGENHIQQLSIQGGEYGGGLYLSGNGSLYINENQSLSQGAILIDAGYSSAKLQVASTVTLKAYLPSEFNIIDLRNTTLSSDGLVFENADTADTYTIFSESGSKLKQIRAYEARSNEWLYKAVNKDDPDGLYGFLHWDSSYEIYKIIEDDSFGQIAIKDNDLSGITPDSRLELYDDEYVEDIFLPGNWIDTFDLYEKNDTQYACYHEQTYSDESQTYVDHYYFYHLREYDGVTIVIPIEEEQDISTIPTYQTMLFITTQ